MHRNFVRAWIAVAIAIPFLFATPSFAQTNFLTDLGAVAPALGINNAGQVVLQNYLYSGGTLQPFPAGFTGAGISSSGAVVGSVAGAGSTNCFDVPALDFDEQCAIGTYVGGSLTTYPIYNIGLDPSVGNQGLGINASGIVVGDWNMAHGVGGALELSNGTFSDLPFPSVPGCGGDLAVNYGIAHAINDAGQIAGMLPWDPTGTGNSCNDYAFVLNQGTYQPIGTGFAYALNSGGDATGYLEFAPFQPAGPNVQHAFLYHTSTAAGAQDLGALAGDTYSIGYGINSSDFVVGDSYSVQSNTPTAFLFNGVILDLNSFVLASDPLKAFVTLTDAQGINDSGLVVVNGIDSRTQAQHAYLLQVPLITVAPGALTFGSAAPGTQSTAQSLTFTNAGSSSLGLGTPTASANFAVTSNNCGNSLAAGAHCSIDVAFAPANAQAAQASTGSATLPAAGVPIAVPLSAPTSVGINASATSAYVGQSVTLTWHSPSGSLCTANETTDAGWTGTVASSGSQTIQITSVGNFTFGISCIVSAQTITAQTAPVSVQQGPPVSVTLTASPTALTSGQSTTLTWTSKNATSCASSGGGADDSWPNSSRPTSGSVTVTEAAEVSSAVTLTFTMTCTGTNELTGSASAQVEETSDPTTTSKSGGSSSSGGGAFDVLSDLGLFLLLVLPRVRRQRLSRAH